MECETLKRFATRRRTDTVFYNMAAMLAGVAAGFDIRISNTTSAVHPSLQQPVRRTPTAQPRRRPTGLQQLGARLSAHLEMDDHLEGFQFTSPTGAPHNTYHGYQTRYRPSVNFDVPMRFTESGYESYPTASDGNRTTPSSDNRTTPSADSRRTTPSVSGASFSIGSQSPHKSSIDETNDNDLVLISLSPSTDKAFVEYQRQLSDTSSVFETPWTTPKSTPQRSTPQRHGVKFEDEVCYDNGETGVVHQDPSTSTSHRSPSLTSGCLSAVGHDGASRHTSDNHPDSSRCHAGIPNPICPPPPRRSSSQERHIQLHGTAERPVTLDIIPRPRPHAGILKRASPVHVASHGSPRGKVMPTPLETIPARTEEPSHLLARSATPSGCSPLVVGTQYTTTLLDIDVEGQKADGTKPLPAKPL